MSLENCRNTLPGPRHSRLIPRLHSSTTMLLPHRRNAVPGDRHRFLASILDEALAISEAISTLDELSETENAASSRTNLSNEIQSPRVPARRGTALSRTTRNVMHANDKDYQDEESISNNDHAEQ